MKTRLLDRVLAVVSACLLVALGWLWGWQTGLEADRPFVPADVTIWDPGAEELPVCSTPDLPPGEIAICTPNSPWCVSGCAEPEDAADVDVQALDEDDAATLTLGYVDRSREDLLTFLRTLEPRTVALVGYRGEDGDIHMLTEADLHGEVSAGDVEDGPLVYGLRTGSGCVGHCPEVTSIAWYEPPYALAVCYYEDAEGEIRPIHELFE